MVADIPSTDQKRWKTVVSEWKFIAAILAPFGVAIALYFIPATKGELEGVKTDTAAKLELAKANTAGSLQAITAKVDALQSTITDTKSDVKEMRGDLKELLKRSEPRQVEYRPEPVKTASPAATDRQDDRPPPPPTSRKIVKKKPIVVKPAAASTSGFRLW
jgi:hypothetical protein